MSTNERPTLSPTMRWFLLVLGVASAFVAATQLVKSFGENELGESELYKKDFVQEWTLAKAVGPG